MGDDDTKRLILSRRARFVAAALASVSAVAQAGACTPSPCLEPVPSPVPDAGTAREAGRDAETPTNEDDSGVPQPCLTTVPPDAESK